MTAAEKIKQYFDKIYEVPLEAWEKFASLGEVKNYKAGTILKKAHTIEKKFYFLISGSGGVMLWSNNNNVCLDIFLEFNFFGDYMSLVTQKNSPLETLLFEDSEILELTAENFTYISNDKEFGLSITRNAVENLFILKQQQQIELLTLTAEERYQKILEEKPEILRRIPQMHIASYLGITPQSLSRIRKNLNKA
jgi:CRP-like cAMP-binding protein